MANLAAKPSVLKLLSLSFLRVYVETDFTAKASAREFDFHGANVGFTIHHSKNEDGRWSVAIGFLTSNEKAKVVCPYVVDIQAIGEFTVSDAVDPANHEKLIFENGSALVYGSIRDMVSTITSRGVHGPLMLPTATFMGAYEDYLKRDEKKKLASKSKRPSKRAQSQQTST